MATDLHRRKRWLKRLGIGLAGVVVVLVIWAAVAPLFRPAPPEPTAAMWEHAERVRILRDGFGVPHVFGQTDADAAFGLAWAHAEDDWFTIQAVLAASRGQLGIPMPDKQSLVNDWYAAFVDVDGEVERGWESLSPEVRAVLDGYAAGLNFYAWHHPDEADARLLPFTGRDIARGFVHKLPLMLGLPDTLGALRSGAPDLGERLVPGSNAHAVAPWRSTDGITRLNVNSHQPWEGPVAWYEAHVHSEEGWDMVGGTFPGSPLILHGHNADLGWALTVNEPDTVDAWKLEVRDGTYRLGDEWLPLEERRAWLPFSLPWGTAWIPRTMKRSRHGPVLEVGDDTYAVRYSTMDRAVGAIEQWYRMSRADSVDAFVAALELTGIPMFNVVWADAEHIGFAYLAAMPDRAPGHDYTAVLDGTDPETIWTDIWPFERLPRVQDPASGWVQACNSTPFAATIGPETPRAADFPAEAGIETHSTNRTLRTHEILADGAPLDREAFLAMKWDAAYAADAPIRSKLLEPIADWEPEHPAFAEARELLLGWDGVVDDSPASAVALLAWRPLRDGSWDVEPDYDPIAAVKGATAHLLEYFGRVQVPLSEVQRLRRGEVDLPLLGGPDVLACTYHEVRGGQMIGDQGDSLVMIVELGPGGIRSDSIHNYGASNRPESPHYADQAPLFLAHELKPVLRTEDAIRRFLEAEYHPGEEWGPPEPTDPFVLLERARAAADR